MTVETFIEKNKYELIQVVKKACPNCTDFSNEELENWIFNDESLYNWALSEGVENI